MDKYKYFNSTFNDNLIFGLMKKIETGLKISTLKSLKFI